MKTMLCILALAGVACGWWWQHLASVDLQARLDALRDEAAALAAARGERNHLERQQPTPEELARWQQAADDAGRLRRDLAEREEQQRRTPAIRPGEWISADAWRNRGNATPLAAVETMLWAGAGGETDAMVKLLQFDDAARAAADALFARLPESARRQHASADALVAAFSTKAIPLSAAQVVWQQQLGPDEAVVGVFLKNPEAMPRSGVFHRIPEDAPAAKTEAAGPNIPPPTAPASRMTRTVVLSLRRDEAQWKLIVPANAVAKIERELGGSR